MLREALYELSNMRDILIDKYSLLESLSTGKELFHLVAGRDVLVC